MRISNIKKSFVHVFGGSILTGYFFVKNLAFILMLGVVMFLFTSQRYTVLSRISEMENLKRELKDAKFESLNISSDLTELSRRSQIERMVEGSGLDLEPTNEPVYRIQKGRW